MPAEDGKRATPRSRLEASSGQFLVDEQPFFYNGVQISTQRLVGRDGWGWSDLDQLFAAAAATHFTVIAVPLLWNRLEISAGVFEWEDVDNAIDSAARHGLSLEFLWFGSQICSLSWESHGTPAFAMEQFDLVCDESGSAVSYTSCDPTADRDVRFVKLDPADPRLLAAETDAIQRTLERVRQHSQAQGHPTVLVGIELLNEPTAVQMWAQTTRTERSFSPSAQKLWSLGDYASPEAFNVSLLWRYLHGLGSAVKQSEYPVWTRVNLYEALEGASSAQMLIGMNETARKRGGTGIDLIGSDLYTQDVDAVFDYCAHSTYRQGSNVAMVMENGGHYPHGDRLLLNALAAGGLYHVWELCDTIPEWPAGLFECDARARSIWPKAHQPRVAKTNALLSNIWLPLASRARGTGPVRILNREFVPNYDDRVILGGHEVHLSMVEPGAALAHGEPDEVFLATTAHATYRFGPDVTSIEIGIFERSGDWTLQRRVDFRQNDECTIVASDAYVCYRVAFEKSPYSVRQSPGHHVKTL